RIDVRNPLLQHQHVVSNKAESYTLDREVFRQELGKVVSDSNLTKFPVASIVDNRLNKTFRANNFVVRLHREYCYCVRLTSFVNTLSDHTTFAANQCFLVQTVTICVEVRTGKHFATQFEVDQE